MRALAYFEAGAAASGRRLVARRPTPPWAQLRSPRRRPATRARVARSRRPSRAADAAPRPAWPWPEPRLTYANGVLPEALIAAGSRSRRCLVQEGLRLLRWLVRGGAAGRPPELRARRRPRSRRSSTRVRPAADRGRRVADACARGVRRDPRGVAGRTARSCCPLVRGLERSGPTDVRRETGGGFDGLTADGRNENQGAESTIALIHAAAGAAASGGGSARRVSGPPPRRSRRRRIDRPHRTSGRSCRRRATAPCTNTTLLTSPARSHGSSGRRIGSGSTDHAAGLVVQERHVHRVCAVASRSWKKSSRPSSVAIGGAPAPTPSAPADGREDRVDVEVAPGARPSSRRSAPHISSSESKTASCMFGWIRWISRPVRRAG